MCGVPAPAEPVTDNLDEVLCEGCLALAAQDAELRLEHRDRPKSDHRLSSQELDILWGRK